MTGFDVDVDEAVRCRMEVVQHQMVGLERLVPRRLEVQNEGGGDDDDEVPRRLQQELQAANVVAGRRGWVGIQGRRSKHTC